MSLRVFVRVFTFEVPFKLFFAHTVNEVWFNDKQCSTVHSIALQLCAVTCRAVKLCAFQFSEVQCSPICYSEAQSANNKVKVFFSLLRGKMWCSAVQCNAVQYSEVQCSSVHFRLCSV